MKRPSKQDFETFKREFLRCVSLLELGEWEIRFNFTLLDHNNYAEINSDPGCCVAEVTLNKDPLTGLNLKHFDVKNIARHEVGHLFVSRLQSMGRDRFVVPDMFNDEVERIATTLEKIL